MSWLRLFRCALVLVVTGCQTSASTSSAPSSSSSERATTTVDNDEWSHLSYVERHERMTFLVHPVLARKFTDARGDGAPPLGCVDCHGDDGERDRYAMPSPVLQPLKPSRVRALYAAGDDVSALIAFMRDEVTPETARLMGRTPYDPATGRGFSCFDCHAAEDE